MNRPARLPRTTPSSRLPLFIFDLDGTVADDEWRHKLLPTNATGKAMIECDVAAIVDPVETDKTYDAYHLRMSEDSPSWAGATILRAAISKGYAIEFSTARPERFRSLAVAWLRAHFGVFNFYANMRKDGECATSPTIKRQHIKDALHRHGNGPTFFYDDRSDVCAMAQSMGLKAYVVERDKITAFDGREVDAEDTLDEDMKEAHRKACRPEADVVKIVAGRSFVDSPKIIAATEVTETVGDVSVKTRTEYALADDPTGAQARFLNSQAAMPGERPVFTTLQAGFEEVAATPAPIGLDPCAECGQKEAGQTGEHPCPYCGIPMLHDEVVQPPNAADVLQGMANTFRERNKVYGNNAEMVGKVMQVLFPKGVRLTTPADYHMWHLFELKIVKLTRFAISGLTHQDSVHDDAVYSAMCELLVGSHAINFKGE